MSISRRITSNSDRVIRCSSAMIVNRDLASSASGEAIPQARPSRKYNASCLFIADLPVRARFELALDDHARHLQHAAVLGQDSLELTELPLDQMMIGRIRGEPGQSRGLIGEHDLARLIEFWDPHFYQRLALWLTRIGVDVYGDGDDRRGRADFGLFGLADLVEMFDLGLALLLGKEAGLCLALAALVLESPLPFDLAFALDSAAVFKKHLGALADPLNYIGGIAMRLEQATFLRFHRGSVDGLEVALQVLRGFQSQAGLDRPVAHGAQHVVALIEALPELIELLSEALGIMGLGS